MMAVHRANEMGKNLERYQRALPGALVAAGMVSVTRIQRIFVIFRPRGVATGATWRSITVSPPYVDGGYMRVRIGPTTAYAWWVEFGRKPGKPPPFDAIYDWVLEKHIAEGAEAIAIAWAIRATIAREGTQAFPAVRVGFRQSQDDALRVFRRTMIRNLAGV